MSTRGYGPGSQAREAHGEICQTDPCEACQRGARAGRVFARKVFQLRGNHSEAHLSERELAFIIEAAVRAALLAR